MKAKLDGIHHITAIAGDAQRNVAFYAGTLGLRLVKRTVNFDDPGTYHLYYGDALGRPGTILTFFPWAGVPRGRAGAGQATVVRFAVPSSSFPFWEERLASAETATRRVRTAFDEAALAFEDPDGMAIELVARDDAPDAHAWAEGPVPVAHAVRGFDGVVLTVADGAHSAAFLREALGMTLEREVEGAMRFVTAAHGQGAPGTRVELRVDPKSTRGRMGVGTVHHIAWRTPDDAAQLAWREALTALGVGVTPVADRQYFHSIYFHEPGGVLFEIATDTPGFAIDEPRETLGTELRLPPWLEPMRERIARSLPALHVPDEARRS